MTLKLNAGKPTAVKRDSKDQSKTLRGLTGPNASEA
jgi:hypothetical protein